MQRHSARDALYLDLRPLVQFAGALLTILLLSSPMLELEIRPPLGVFHQRRR
jgi:hypothetical protein